jgi:hypothetical protein
MAQTVQLYAQNNKNTAARHAREMITTAERRFPSASSSLFRLAASASGFRRWTPGSMRTVARTVGRSHLRECEWCSQ